MAVVKVTRTRKTRQTYTTNRASIKASIRYIAHRAGKDGEKITRPLFNEKGEEITKHAAYRLIDQAGRGMKFVRIVLSPDPQKEDTRRDLRMRELTRETISALTKKYGRPISFIAAIHDDHTDIRHIHIIALVDKRLTVTDFRLLREAATNACRSQRQLLDAHTQRARHWHRTIKTAIAKTVSARSKGALEAGRTVSEYDMVKPLAPTCPNCGMGQPLKRIPGGRLWCPSCRLRMAKEGLGITIEKKALKLEQSYE